MARTIVIRTLVVPAQYLDMLLPRWSSTFFDLFFKWRKLVIFDFEVWLCTSNESRDNLFDDGLSVRVKEVDFLMVG
ncbi:hypothetical protein QBC32DRAFT_316343 [Pseudoneurospora amorphoporcata]|uniref:Uncharacterized protein n=1 Tax=Pseudoneurospora amorphoporcata TaxID=241081 RepID=A0AAN6NTJ2_9PEZI|nr:hypothetical protein QBC32DRAFT_316343 [Pseudoneurospora amorphoporcata]